MLKFIILGLFFCVSYLHAEEKISPLRDCVKIIAKTSSRLPEKVFSEVLNPKINLQKLRYDQGLFSKESFSSNDWKILIRDVNSNRRSKGLLTLDGDLLPLLDVTPNLLTIIRVGKEKFYIDAFDSTKVLDELFYFSKDLRSISLKDTNLTNIIENYEGSSDNNLRLLDYGAGKSLSFATMVFFLYPTLSVHTIDIYSPDDLELESSLFRGLFNSSNTESSSSNLKPGYHQTVFWNYTGLPTEHYDLVISNHSLLLKADSDNFSLELEFQKLFEALRVLKVGGLFIYSGDNDNSRIDADSFPSLELVSKHGVSNNFTYVFKKVIPLTENSLVLRKSDYRNWLGKPQNEKLYSAKTDDPLLINLIIFPE